MAAWEPCGSPGGADCRSPCPADAHPVAPAQPLPLYACALLQDDADWWVLQLRPQGARHAPGQLTCFGGRCEPGEDAASCLRRELLEELAWTPAVLGESIALWQGELFVATFLRCRLNVPWVHLRTEVGHVAMRAPTRSLPGLPLSPWHAAVLHAAAGGVARVTLPG